MDELKSCPFCGMPMVIVCSDLEDSAPYSWLCTSGWCCKSEVCYETEEAAIADANRRVDEHKRTCKTCNLTDNCGIRAAMAFQTLEDGFKCSRYYDRLIVKYEDVIDSFMAYASKGFGTPYILTSEEVGLLKAFAEYRDKEETCETCQNWAINRRPLHIDYRDCDGPDANLSAIVWWCDGGASLETHKNFSCKFYSRRIVEKT